MSATEASDQTCPNRLGRWRCQDRPGHTGECRHDDLIVTWRKDLPVTEGATGCGATYEGTACGLPQRHGLIHDSGDGYAWWDDVSDGSPRRPRRCAQRPYVGRRDPESAQCVHVVDHPGSHQRADGHRWCSDPPEPAPPAEAGGFERGDPWALLTEALTERDAARAETEQAVEQRGRLYEACEQMEAEVTQLRAELARLRAPVWTEATREAVGSAAMSCCLSSAPHSLRDIGQAVETALAALAQSAGRGR